jgi:predicted Zn-dependent protease with MMP-like domain
MHYHWCIAHRYRLTLQSEQRYTIAILRGGLSKLMQSDDFIQLVEEALDGLPPEFGRYLDNVEILVEDAPTADHLRAVDLGPDDVLYGSYEGVPLTERTSLDLGDPAIIILFQQPLEQDFPDPDDLRDQVRRTVLHEVAHHFGISDDRLHELGAY